jgi:hypothetical protein
MELYIVSEGVKQAFSIIVANSASEAKQFYIDANGEEDAFYLVLNINDFLKDDHQPYKITVEER